MFLILSNIVQESNTVQVYEFGLSEGLSDVCPWSNSRKRNQIAMKFKYFIEVNYCMFGIEN